MILSPELEERIAARVRSGEHESPTEVVSAALELLEAKVGAVATPAAAACQNETRSIQNERRPIWEIIVEHGEQIPEDELDQLPTDLARNYKHYLYGVPRRES